MVELGFVHHYKAPDEHCHQTYEELMVCAGEASEKMEARAAKAAATRTGTRGKHARKVALGAADKPTRAGTSA